MNEQKREVTEAVAARIRYLRRIKEFSQEEVALRAGLNPAYFGQVERGMKCPTIDTLCKIARALDTSPAELFRSDVLPDSPENYNWRFQDLIARVPVDKLDQVFKIMEDVTKLL